LAGFGFQKEKSLRSMNFHNSPFATFRLLCFGFRLPVLGVFMSVSCTYATEDVLCAYCDVSVYVRLCARACKSLSRFVIPIFFSLEKKKKKKEEVEEFRCVGGFGFCFFIQHPGLTSHTSAVLFFHLSGSVSLFLLRTREWQLALLSLSLFLRLSLRSHEKRL
jgi:hypothetical protein